MSPGRAVAIIAGLALANWVLVLAFFASVALHQPQLSSSSPSSPTEFEISLIVEGDFGDSAASSVINSGMSSGSGSSCVL